MQEELCTVRLKSARCRDHLRGVLQTGFRHGGAAEHACNFMRAGPLVEQSYLGLRTARGFAFVDEEVLVGKCGDLRQMGHA